MMANATATSRALMDVSGFASVARSQHGRWHQL
jgi:hypothetical protein